jgi:isoleucyl-tRNA synthetase
VLRREAPFRTILGYATLFAEDGRPMHKSWGNAIEFNEAAERMGVDVMRWMYARHRPEDNILFGYGTADEARRDLLVLWNVAAFFVTYARLAGWAPGPSGGADEPDSGRSVLDRWIVSRVAATADTVRHELSDFDVRAATTAIGVAIDDLSQWYLRRSRRRFSRNEDPADREAAFATMHQALSTLAAIMAPILPFLAEELYQVLIAERDTSVPDSVHLTRWPSGATASGRDQALESAMGTLRRAVELARTLRGQAGIRLRQPLATLWLALPGGRLAEGLAAQDEAALLAILGDEMNVKAVELIGDGSELVERRVKPLLPLIGRKLGDRIPAVMAAARANEVEYLPDGSVALAGLTLAPHEVEIMATPRPGTAVAHHDGLVVVIDTTLTPALRAEGDAREVSRAVQELRKQAELALDARIELWLDGDPSLFQNLDGHLRTVTEDTLADALHREPLPEGMPVTELALESGRLRIGLRERVP